MSVRPHLAVLLTGTLLSVPTLAAWDTVIFQDDFSGADGTPDSNRWIVNHPESCWWVQGRTFFPSPTDHPEAPFPHIEDGRCVIEHHLYNDYHRDSPKTTFLGGEIRSAVEFDPNRAYRFEARVKGNVFPGGLVTSFFTYGYDGAVSDEIDFEFLSNHVNDNATYPEGDPVLTNPWDESAECPQLVRVPGLDVTEWNTFRIYWEPDQEVKWTWLDPANGERTLRTETLQCLPDEPMALYFNFWAPMSGWSDAYDGSLIPVQNESENEIHTYAIDYATVSVTAPTVPGDLNGDGSVRSADLDIVRANWGQTVTPGDLASGGRQRGRDRPKRGLGYRPVELGERGGSGPGAGDRTADACVRGGTMLAKTALITTALKERIRSGKKSLTRRRERHGGSPACAPRRSHPTRMATRQD